MTRALMGPLRGRKAAILALVSVLVIGALIAVSLTRPWSVDEVQQEVAPPGPGDRVLQSVHVTMQPDGALSEVSDTAVVARAVSGSTDTISAGYDPNAVVDQLPVRVLTSYRTDQKTGTDLSELKGHTGRVSIELRVENLTVRPQQVRYDVAGRSRTSTAMVGAPLTVVASAALPGTDPSSVVTGPENGSGADPGKEAGATNGVLSQAADETTQVQWATILAPPQLGTTATLRLVVDAKDFAPPSVGLSVQPGLVTDASLGALVDAAFNPQGSPELALQSRTIKLIGDVNQVLVRASDTISKVRGTLDTTSTTLGTKTVGALRTSTRNVTASMKSSSDNLESLGQDLSSSLESTSSATLSTMAGTVAQLDQVLGDTSSPPPAAPVKGDGCDQEVAGPTRGASVYASLQQVGAQLDGYAAATDACKVLLQRAILDSIGPVEPSAESCTTPSVTCSLAGVQTSFAAIADKFVADGQLALAGLGPDGLEPVSASLTTLVEQLRELNVDAANLLGPADKPEQPDPDEPDPTEPDPDADDPESGPGAEEPDPVVEPEPTFETIGVSLAEAGETLATLATALDAVHQDALDGAERAASMQEQNADLAARLCALVGDGTLPGTLSLQQVEELRSYLTSRSCPGPDGVTTELAPPKGYDGSMQTRLGGQANAFTEIATDLDTEDGSSAVGDSVAALTTGLAAARTQLDLLATASTQDEQALAERVEALQKSLDEATETATGLTTTVDEVKTGYGRAKTELAQALEQAGEDAKVDVQRSVDAEIRRIGEQGQADSDRVGEMFERSAAGLSATAQEIRRDGARAVQGQRDGLSKTQEQAEATLSAGTLSAVTRVSQDVSSSTRDLEATRALLTQDLANVLLDLGDRKVRGSGVLGALATSAAATGSADFQLALASDKGSAYAAVRERDLGGIMLRQAQAEAALERQAAMMPFVREFPSTVAHRTVYVFSLDGNR